MIFAIFIWNRGNCAQRNFLRAQRKLTRDYEISNGLEATILVTAQVRRDIPIRELAETFNRNALRYINHDNIEVDTTSLANITVDMFKDLYPVKVIVSEIYNGI